MKNVLVTGGTGFIGSHIIEYILEKTDWNVIVIGRLKETWKIPVSDRIRLIKTDLTKSINIDIDNIDYVFHLAAKTLVDDSIKNPISFIKTNVLGTANLFEYIRKNLNPEKIINYGTDEVYGPAPINYNFKEDDRWRPSSPYSASKCGQMAIGMAYAKTYGLPIIHTYTMNVFGERQSNDKLIPIAIRKLIENKPIPIHCKIENGNPTEIGSRMWLYAKSAADATLFLLNNGKVNEHYNISGDIELDNISMVNRIAEIINIKGHTFEYVDFHKTRPGHDRRYSLSGDKIHKMGWRSPYKFDESLKLSVRWYLDNTEKLYEGICTI